MTFLQAAWLGIVQGVTEFLPVSSSAHLILFRAVFGWDAGDAEITFDVACHLGTLFAVLIYFRRDAVQLVAAIPGALTGQTDDAPRTGRVIAVATVPIVLVGWLFVDLIEGLRVPAVAAGALAVGAVGMLVVERVGERGRETASLSMTEAVGLGLAQAAAMVPGVSRSGAVITIAMLMGIRREEAARFAFLLGIPAILGAGGRAVWILGGAGLVQYSGVLLAGFVASGIVGYLAISGLIRYLARHTLDVFAYYRLGVALVLCLWLVG